MVLWLFEVVVLPWIGPGLQLPHTPSRRDDISELAGVLIFPLIYLALGAWLIKAHTPDVPPGHESASAQACVRRYRRFAIAALVFLVTFQALMVIALSLIRYVPAERDIGWGMFTTGVVLYGGYFLFSVCAFVSRRAAARIVSGDDGGIAEDRPEALDLLGES